LASHQQDVAYVTLGTGLGELRDRVAKPLLPFGVTADDLHALVHRKLMKHWGLGPPE